MKVWELYRLPGGRFSNQSRDYDGPSKAIFRVAAENSKQAHVLARRGVWATDADNPVGIVDTYRAEDPSMPWHRLFDGCQIDGAMTLDHGDGKRKIQTWMRAHLKEHGS